MAFEKITEEVEDFQPDIIIMDIKLPYYNGFYWCAEIRKTSKVPIVFLSSADDNMNIVMAMNMGGDEFIIILAHRQIMMLQKILNDIRTLFSKPWMLKGADYYCTMSMGVVRFPTEGDTVEELIKKADIALYAAKCSGKNRVEFYDENVESTSFRRLDMEKNMRNATRNAFDEFEVYYQPIYSLSAKRYNSAEALLRLYDEKYGYVRPDIFIPAAEKSGMIHKIGKFVLEEVCRFIVSDKFKELGLDYIEVNLSVIQCMSSELADDVREIMNRYNVSSEQLNLEITETAAAYAQTTMMNNIEELNDDGIAFSLDDFGTGYSNMKRIASMPFAIVKLDKTFTEMNENDKMLKVVKNTISMVRDMNLRILVEGVETLESFKEFKALGVDYIQGYYFSKPLPMEKFVSEVKRVNMD